MTDMIFSYSNIKLWRRCHRAWHYKYRVGIRKKSPSHQLVRGSLFHLMSDAYVTTGDWTAPLQEYRIKYAQLWDEEADRYGAPEDVENLFLRYINHYVNDGLTYQEVGGRKSEIEFQVEYQGVKFKGIVDKVPVDKNGLTWVMDHKTHKTIPSEEARFSDIQTVLYYWGLNESGLAKADGVLWDYIRTKPPAIPEVLKSGGLSKRKNIDTTYDVYLETIHQHGLNPADYSDILGLLKDKRTDFFVRVPLPRPNKDLVKSVVSDMIDTAQEIQRSNAKDRNLTKDCSWCEYFPICQAEVRGHDSEFIIKVHYEGRKDGN